MRPTNVTIDGATKSVLAWCKERGISHSTVGRRIREGMSPKEAILNPIKKRKPLNHIEGQHKKTAAMRRWREKNKTKGLCHCGRKRRDNRSKCQICAENHMASERKRKFGVDKEYHEQLLQEQDHKCAICKIHVDKSSHIDHCHKSKVVRYILCRSCNMFLGHYEKFKDAGLLGKIESYLLMFDPFDTSPLKQSQNK